MTNSNSIEISSLTKEAYQRAGKNKWIEAAAFCQQALNKIDALGDKSDVASLTEFSANCHFKGAFQAPNRQEFKELMTASRKASETACTLHGAHEAALSKRAEIGVKTAEFWMQDDPRERLILARSIVEISEESTRLFDDSGKPDEALESRIRLLGFFREFINLCTDFNSLKATFDQAVHSGRITMKRLNTNNNVNGKVEALSSMVWFFAVEAQVVLSPSEFQSLANETRIFQADLQEASRKAATPIAVCLARESAGHIAFDIAGEPTLALKRYQKSLAIATTIGDSLAIGKLQWMSSQAAYWLGYGENDPDKRRSSFKKGENYALDAIQNLEIPFQTTELSASHAVYAQCLVELANLSGTDALLKKKLLEKAVQISSRGVTYESGTWAWSRAAHTLARALYFLSKIEGHERRLRLLREALGFRERIVEVNDRLFPNFWNNVTEPYNLALVRSEIASVEDDKETKKQLLTQAISEIELCMTRGENWGTNPGFLYRLAEHSEAYGEILSKLHAVTSDPALAHKAVKAYERAIDRLAGSKSTATIAALGWKIAGIYDTLRSFQLASDEFRKAAADYRKAISDVAGSASLFDDLAHYLDAWSVIETARLQHDEGEYLSASEYYSAAARLLGESREWTHLSPLFTARSLLEKGEGLSSEEKHSGAIESLGRAIDQFREEGRLLEKKLQETSEVQEKRELEDWLEIALQRESYCLARLQLEEARALDKKGDKRASARKFQISAQTLTALLGKVSDVQERAELEGLAKFCDGWAKMKEAEARASPELYSEAAESFLALRSTQTKGQFLHLAFANAAICKALGAGTLFQQTRDVQYYSEVKKQTEAAAESFRAAGFRKTEAWTRATQRLFDSLIFITDAESERDPVRKTELYHLAENHLELAARLYGEAGFPTRKEEALSHLERIREEKQVLLAPLEALSQIPTATATSLSLSPRGRGQPIGTQRFDEAYVVGDLNIPQKEVPLGTVFILDLEIANVGKAPATLVKLQNVLPEGFELASKEDSEISQGGILDLKGRNLEHLKTHAVKVQVRAARKGAIELRPRLFYVDDSGIYKTYQFRPTT